LSTVTAAGSRRQSTVVRRIKKGAIGALWALAGVLLCVLMWELVKWLGGIVSIPVNTTDLSMPHVWTMINGAWQPEVRGSSTTVLQAVLLAAAYSLLIALGGFVIGVAVGLLLAIIMQRFAFLERGLLPFVIASQTVPLIALAPLITGIGNRFSIGPVQWNSTYSVMFIAAYLAFFPLSVGALRGLHAPTDTSLELMRSYAATPRATLIKLRFPASLPYLSSLRSPPEFAGASDASSSSTRERRPRSRQRSTSPSSERLSSVSSLPGWSRHSTYISHATCPRSRHDDHVRHGSSCKRHLEDLQPRSAKRGDRTPGHRPDR
jgi:ABC-type nitrate/sulfonate/bicarbonate transport system permease component